METKLWIFKNHLTVHKIRSNKILKNLKKEEDNTRSSYIPVDIYKNLKDQGNIWLTVLFNKILRTKKITEDVGKGFYSN